MDFRDPVKHRFLDKGSLVSFGIILAATFFRFHGLANQPLWYDELISIDLATFEGGFRSIWDLTFTKLYPHPPLFIAILHLLFQGFAPSEFSARLPSVFGSLLAFPLLYRYLVDIANTLTVTRHIAGPSSSSCTRSRYTSRTTSPAH